MEIEMGSSREVARKKARDVRPRVDSAVTLVDWLLRHGDEEGAFCEVLDRIAAGGSMADLCDEIGVRPGYLMAWVRGDEKRNRRYDRALMDRKHIDVESVRRLWVRTIAAKPEEVPTVREQLVASEMLARHAGALSDGAAGAGRGDRVQVSIRIDLGGGEGAVVGEGEVEDIHTPSEPAVEGADAEGDAK